MKLILNILFEKLNRFVFDHYYQSTNTDFGLPTKYTIANRHNKLEKYNKKIAHFYNWCCPYFVGWQESLLKKYPDKPKYQRYK